MIQWFKLQPLYFKPTLKILRRFYMKCPYCGYNNDENVNFCNNCGKSLIEPIKKGMETSTKMLIVLCIVLVGGLGIAAGMLMNVNPGNLLTNTSDNATNTSTSSSISGSQSNGTATWHQIATYYSPDVGMKSFNIKGARVKITMTGTPTTTPKKPYDRVIQNAYGSYVGSNQLRVNLVMDQKLLETGYIEWDIDKEAPVQKECTIESATGPGPYEIKITAPDMGNWQVIVWDFY